MCEDAKPTPEDQQVPCSRCGKICNPNDNWQYGWPLHGYMKLGATSCIDSTLLRDVMPYAELAKNPMRHDIVFGGHPLVKEYGPQCIELHWCGDNSIPVHPGGKRYRLCYDCQEKLLSMIGQFFFGEVKKSSEGPRLRYGRVPRGQG